MKTERIVLKNRVEELNVMAVELERIGDIFGLTMAEVTNLNLVMEEAVSNVINYAFSDTENHLINIALEYEAPYLKICISDDGRPFDPTSQEAPDTTLAVEERPIGGLGVFLINQMMDEVSYWRENDKNIFTMSKSFYK